jgi:hypothetical protein
LPRGDSDGIFYSRGDGRLYWVRSGEGPEGLRMVGPPFNFRVERRPCCLERLPEEESLDAKYVIIAVLMIAFVASLIAYGIWLKKGEKEESEQTTKPIK